MKHITIIQWMILTFLIFIVIAELVRASSNNSPQPQTPAQVYEECVKRIPSEFMTIELYQDEIEICLQVASSTQ